MPDNPSDRIRISAHVLANPGLTAYAIARALGMTDDAGSPRAAVARLHLQQLEESGAVVATKNTAGVTTWAPPDPDEWGDGDYCEHICDEDCNDYQGFSTCSHQHCFACGDCTCAGYCDDYQTYNLRPAETGGTAP